MRKIFKYVLIYISIAAILSSLYSYLFTPPMFLEIYLVIITSLIILATVCHYFIDRLIGSRPIRSLLIAILLPVYVYFVTGFQISPFSPLSALYDTFDSVINYGSIRYPDVYSCSYSEKIIARYKFSTILSDSLITIYADREELGSGKTLGSATYYIENLGNNKYRGLSIDPKRIEIIHQNAVFNLFDSIPIDIPLDETRILKEKKLSNNQKLVISKELSFMENKKSPIVYFQFLEWLIPRLRLKKSEKWEPVPDDDKHYRVCS